jgi:hypothetical protein
MTAVAGQTVEERIDAAVARIMDSGEDFVLREEATALVDDCEPDALLAYLRRTAISLIGQRIRFRLAALRAAEVRSVFARDDDDEALSPFETRFAVKGDVWRRVGDMTRPDWEYVAEDRADSARASLFDIALAKSVAAMLPDDITPTRQALNEEEFERLETTALSRAEKTLQRFQR